MVAHTYIALPPIVDIWFQVLFHSPPGVLFTFPSRYSFTIGHQGVFSLTQWSGQIPTEFHVLCGTWETKTYVHLISRLQDCHFLWSLVPEQFNLISYLGRQNHLSAFCSRIPYVATSGFLHNISFWLFPFRSPLLRESLRFLFLALLRCFSSCRFLLRSMYSVTDTDLAVGGFPHSEILGSMLVCQLPEAFRRLRRPSSPPTPIVTGKQIGRAHV